MSITELKNLSREQLKGYWGQAVGVLLIYIMINIILLNLFGQIPFVGTILQAIILTFFDLGIIAFLFNITKKKAQVSDMFSQSKIWKKGIAISLILGSVSFLATFLTELYNIVADVDNAFILISWLGITTSILFVVSIIVYLIFGLSSTILVDNPKISAIDALKRSSKLMKGQKVNLVLLGLSFVGWMLLSIITFGIGFLWLGPYMQLTFINFYISLKKKK